MAKNSIMIDLNDPRTAKIADVISNKTSKKVLELLAQGEFSGSEIAVKLKLPLNTVTYNIKKLEDAGLIEKVKGFLWSVKGRRVYRYKISNKRIIISPKSMLRGVIPSVLISGLAALGIKSFVGVNTNVDGGVEKLVAVADAEIAVSSGSEAVSSGSIGVADILPPDRMPEVINKTQETLQGTDAWAWFMLGALTGLFLFLLWNSINERRWK